MRSLVANPPDTHDLDCITRAIEAGARGDAEASLAHELSGSVILESPHRFILQDLIDQGDAAPGWAYSRWCTDLAFRSMLMAADPRTDLAVRCVLGALYPDSLAAVVDDPRELQALGTMVAGGDHMAMDLALYELGGLADYIAEHAQPGLLDRTDHVQDWASAQMRAYEFIDFRGCRLVLHDLVDDCEVDALNVGAMADATDESLIGRLVPISSEPGLMFAARPIFVDRGIAQEVAEGVRTSERLAWLDPLADAVESGRCEEGFHRTPFTLFTSDLPLPEIVVDDDSPEEAEAGWVTEMRAKGHSAEVANALAVLQVGLIAAGISDQSAAAVSADVVAALTTPGAFDAAKAECTGPETADQWRILSAVVPEHVAERCRALAADADTAETVS